MTNHQKCCLCGRELGDVLPVKYYGKDAHMRCVDNKLRKL